MFTSNFAVFASIRGFDRSLRCSRMKSASLQRKRNHALRLPYGHVTLMAYYSIAAGNLLFAAIGDAPIERGCRVSWRRPLVSESERHATKVPFAGDSFD